VRLLFSVGLVPKPFALPPCIFSRRSFLVLHMHESVLARASYLGFGFGLLFWGLTAGAISGHRGGKGELHE